MIENYLLVQFTAFARCGTLMKTSEELHISQPTLSRSMKKLEDELGISLFHRENSKLILNETGKIAAEYAERALAANREMIDHVTAFDRSLRTVSIGACAPFPINKLMPIFQEYCPGKTILTTLEDDDHLITGLQDRQYNLVILHSLPRDKSLFSQRCLDEQLYISIDERHPLARKNTVTFEELRGIRILVSGNVGFWMDVCKRHLESTDLLTQSNAEALDALVNASFLPLFNSDRMIALGYNAPSRKSIPISDADAHADYWLVCRATERRKYHSLFNAAQYNI